MICNLGINVNGQLYGIATSMHKAKSLARALIVLTDIKGDVDTVLNKIIENKADYDNIIPLDEQRKLLLNDLAEYIAMDPNYNMQVKNVILTQKTGLVLHFMSHSMFTDEGYIKHKIKHAYEDDVDIIVTTKVQKINSVIGSEYTVELLVHYDV